MDSLFGIDTSGPASQKLMDKAADLIGGPPKFWGRFFNGTKAHRDYQYDKSENAILRHLGIPLLCFARQMWAVDDWSQAAAHAHENMKGVVEAMGAQYLLSQRISPIMYLDLEPETDKDHPHPVMDQKYYENWSAAITAGYPAGAGTVRFRPAVYLNMGDNQKSWLNLNAARANRAACEGVSVARYFHSDDNPIAPPPRFDRIVWKDSDVRPKPNPIPPGHEDARIPVLVWQYYGDYPKFYRPDGKIGTGDIDFEMVNPAYNDLVKSGVIPLPPAGDA